MANRIPPQGTKPYRPGADAQGTNVGRETLSRTKPNNKGRLDEENSSSRARGKTGVIEEAAKKVGLALFGQKHRTYRERTWEKKKKRRNDNRNWVHFAACSGGDVRVGTARLSSFQGDGRKKKKKQANSTEKGMDQRKSDFFINTQKSTIRGKRLVKEKE